MFITRAQWDRIAEPSSAPIVQDVLDSLDRGIKVTVKDAGQPPYKEFAEIEEFKAEYRKQLRARRKD